MSAADPTAGPPESESETEAAPTVLFDLEHIDYSGFDSPLEATEVNAYRDRVITAQQARVGPLDPRTTTSRSMIVGLLIFFTVCFVGSLSQLLVPVLGGHGIVGWIPLELSILFAFLTLASTVQTRAEFANKQWGKRARLPRFARNNGLTFRSVSSAPSYPGMIFRQGDSRTVIERLTSSSRPYVDLGTLEYWIRSSRSRYVVRWSYVALRLDRMLPHMLLIAKANQGLGGSGLPATFQADQILSLEGDFDRYFTLYCPRDYETDALYVFTPDLMALLIDHAQSFDVEIVDDWMFVVVRKALPVTKLTYERLFSIIRTVGTKAASQSKNYHDDNVGSFEADVVAPGGRVLRKNVSVVRIIILAIVLAVMIAIPIGAFILNESVTP